MLAANLNKIMKSALANITFILNVYLEKGIILVWMSLVLKSKNDVSFTKACFFKPTCVEKSIWTSMYKSM